MRNCKKKKNRRRTIEKLTFQAKMRGFTDLNEEINNQHVVVDASRCFVVQETLFHELWEPQIRVMLVEAMSKNCEVEEGEKKKN
jgi:hypothetical protein